MSAPEELELLKFQNLTSDAVVSFWKELSRLKLEKLKLDDSAIPITGHFRVSPNANAQFDAASGNVPPALLELSHRSYVAENPAEVTDRPSVIESVTLNGLLYNVNTLQAFKTADKNKLLAQCVEKNFDLLNQGATFTNVGSVATFVVLAYADLKKHTFVYWFGFPTLKMERPQLPKLVHDASVPLSTFVQSVSSRQHIANQLLSMGVQSTVPGQDWSLPLHFLVEIDFSREEGPACTLHETKLVSQLLQATAERGTQLCLGCMDASTSPQTSSWPIRNLLNMMQLAGVEWPDSQVTLISIRDAVSATSPLSESRVFKINLPTVPRRESASDWHVFGWEMDRKGRPRPRVANLASQMDPMALMSTAVDLNLKLMRWRMLPELNTEKLAGTKCLLVGAGTLGCAVARTLLGWGIRHITFVDSGRVTYSNPCRQSLFEFEDARLQKPKAEAAAAAVKRIFPSAVSTGYSIRVPMPGHGSGGDVGSKADTAIVEAAVRLGNLIAEHDVVFLLTDTRESRWLPSLLALHHNRLVINSALGFDTYLVMRHGVRRPNSDGETTQSSDGARLGCYFCNDVVAPGNSTLNRTLDQQCTVSRPALAMMAGALAAELMVVLLHHPLGPSAPADKAQELHFRTSSPLGLVPHQIRGYLSHHRVLLPHATAFPQCSCCSETILNLYAQDGVDFLRKAFNDPSYLETVSGLAALQASATGWDDDDMDFDSD